MKKEVLFIQGGGNGGYEEDAHMVASLQTALGPAYEVDYPRMEVDEALSDFGWLRQIGSKMEDHKDGVVLAGHSLGASLLLKYLSEEKLQQQLYGIFLMATAFWHGDQDWVKGIKLRKDFADTLPRDVPIFFYHCRDDNEVPFDHFLLYKQKLPFARFREMAHGGHQLGNDLTPVAEDIKKEIKCEN